MKENNFNDITSDVKQITLVAVFLQDSKINYIFLQIPSISFNKVKLVGFIVCL